MRNQIISIFAGTHCTTGLGSVRRQDIFDLLSHECFLSIYACGSPKFFCMLRLKVFLRSPARRSKNLEIKSQVSRSENQQLYFLNSVEVLLDLLIDIVGLLHLLPMEDAL